MSQTASVLPSPDVRFHIAGEWLTAQPEGGLWWGTKGTLIVSDLHLEKGSSYAAKGQLLPPYDTRATLGLITAMYERLRPTQIISLGDSFHDADAEQRLAKPDVATLQTFTSNCEWIWVKGNHDPDPPKHLGGRASQALQIGPLTFRHEPTGAAGEIAGHLHPAAKVRGRGRSVRRPCFVLDSDRLIMPALGAFTGGLNVLDEAFHSLFQTGFSAFALADKRIFAIPSSKLAPDTNTHSKWRY